MKISLIDVAKENNIDVDDIARKVNIIYALADVQEQYFVQIETRLNKLGMKMPKFKQDVYELKKAIRQLVGTVNRVCKPETTQHFADDSDELYTLINEFCKDKL